MKSRIQFAIFNNVCSFGFRYIGVYYVYISYGLRLSALLTGWREGDEGQGYYSHLPQLK